MNDIAYCTRACDNVKCFRHRNKAPVLVYLFLRKMLTYNEFENCANYKSFLNDTEENPHVTK